MPLARSLIAAASIALATFGAAQEPICDPCVDGPEMFEHRRIQTRDPIESLRDRMSAAVTAAVQSGFADQCSPPERCSWLLGAAGLRFFRGVASDGHPLMSGWVCGDDVGIPRQRYYAERLLLLSKCIAIEWDGEYEEYSLDVLPGA